MDRLKILAGTALVCLLVSGCSSAGGEEYKACVEKGISYFKEIEAWPKLSDGRNAEAVAAERCQRTTGAFG